MCHHHPGRPDYIFAGRVTHSDNGITNGIDLFDDVRLGACVMTANNDAAVYIFDAASFKLRQRLSFPWPVNYATLRPDGSLVAVVGDDPMAHLHDLRSGAAVHRLAAHRDFSFAAGASTAVRSLALAP